VDHNNGELDNYLSELPDETPVAFETLGSWYWLADKIEEAGHIPRLTHAGKAKLMMGKVNKTDSLDAEGLAWLQKAGTLPEVWIPPRELRDQREVLRYRVKLGQSRTRWKNRIQAVLRQYGIRINEVSDVFGKKGQEILRDRLNELPEESRNSVINQLDLLNEIERQIKKIEQRLETVLEDTPERVLVKTVPGFGTILSAIAVLEIGDVRRFPGPGNLASYGGTTPTVHASGGHERYGSVRKDVNQILKWALFQAANSVIRQQEKYQDSRLIRKYQLIQERKGSQKAKGAVARMLAESLYWVLTKKEAYKEPDQS
jgi:transposase